MAFGTVKIRIWGVVQGVGFRPFVAKLADSTGINGEIKNAGGLVEITVTGEGGRIDEFIENLKAQKPAPAEIVHIETERAGYRDFAGFKITGSAEGEGEAVMIPADLSVCQNCVDEMNDKANKRYRHPFISCSACGPRYTIMDKLPYDRENTSMSDFTMCGFCESQYRDIKDKRYHAQTISCHVCGPVVLYRDSGGENIAGSSDEMISLAASLLREGRVIAVKGAGGYNFICDPFQNNAVAALREAKKREEKPFAVMFLNIGQIEEYCEAGETEKRLLSSSARPILLLERKAEDRGHPGEFKKNRFIGAFLPGMGLHYLLLEACGKPLIVTSANLSGQPMIKDDGEMFELCHKSDGLIAGVLFNEREIRAAVDDSVARVIDGKPQMIRRSKGYAPVPLHIRADGSELDKSIMMLACGGQLKNSFALSKGSFSYMSQYFGDLDSLDNMRVYEENILRMKALFGINPGVVVCDLHPLYETTAYAEKYAEKNGIKLIKVQHHHAHVASGMAEHGIDGPVIGVSFDGTGYGTDGKIWGGEFLICRGGEFKRAAHLKYIDMIGGDASMKDARKSAMSYALAYYSGTLNEKKDDEIIIDIREMIEMSDIRSNKNWDIVKKAVENKVNTIQSSSMGRLFDAVSSLLGICHENRYEGECAMMLEDAAARALKCPGASRQERLALKFHEKVADTILDRCVKIREEDGIVKVVLTGGVFQNKILMEKALSLLRGRGFEVYYNISVSPNDGGIALGQNFVGMHLYATGGEKCR